MAESVVAIEGVNEFRAALRAAQGTAPRALTAGLKKAGIPVVRMAQARMPHRTGTLAGSLKVSVSGTKGSIVSSAPYAGGAEWGRYGKWSGWVSRYGAPPRFVWPTVELAHDVIAALVLAELKQVVEIYGWAHG